MRIKINIGRVDLNDISSHTATLMSVVQVGANEAVNKARQLGQSSWSMLSNLASTYTGTGQPNPTSQSHEPNHTSDIDPRASWGGHGGFDAMDGHNSDYRESASTDHRNPDALQPPASSWAGGNEWGTDSSNPTTDYIQPAGSPSKEKGGRLRASQKGSGSWNEGGEDGWSKW